MTAALEGVRVLDLTWGVAGPMAGMLLADQGAEVTKIEPPGGDPFRSLPGYRTWMRGRRSIELDLTDPADRAVFDALVERSDVVVESHAPATAQRLGLTDERLRAVNPAIILCSISGYGDTSHADRPAYDALVAARTGIQWEIRGWPGGTIDRLCGREPMFPELDVPDGCAEGPARPGPVFSASSWPSLAACFLATAGISAALLARRRTGVGQHVRTSLLQGVFALTIGGWQRPEHPDAPFYQSWIFDPRGTKGAFRCADGRWVHHWVPNPAFVLGATAGDTLDVSGGINSPRQDPTRIGPNTEEIVVLHHYYPEMAAAFARFPADEWVRAGAEVDVALQPIRSPEAALADDALVADGCVARIDHPELGPVRQVGLAYRLHGSPGQVAGPAPRVGQHNDEIRAEAATPPSPAPAPTAEPAPTAGRPPLDGVRVIDLGLAVAGPFSTQVLSDLGADVIKVNTLWDGFWHSTHIAHACNRGKRSISVDLKTPEGLAIVLDLVRGADVVQHNMRYDAAIRLGLDAETLMAMNPRLVYCHSRGHDSGPRAAMPGNDQTGAALAGVSYEDGAVHAGGKPLWALTSMGDTGNGFLAAIGIVQALYDREITGRGQFVDTAIVNACLLNTSYATIREDGEGFPRPRLDALAYGLGAGYRLYECADGWLCVAVLTSAHWESLGRALGDGVLDDPRFADDRARAEHDTELAAAIGARLLGDTAAAWFARLDAEGVPCEISSPDFALGVFDDPELRERGWTTSYRQRAVGQMDQFGLLVDFSETPGRIAGPPLSVGDHTRAILRELGRTDDEIDGLVAAGVVVDAPDAPGSME